MADLPLEGRTVVETAKQVPITLEKRVELLTQDVQEVARGINTQAKLLESIVLACDHIVKKYVELTTPKQAEVSNEAPKEETAKV